MTYTISDSLSLINEYDMMDNLIMVLGEITTSNRISWEILYTVKSPI